MGEYNSEGVLSFRSYLQTKVTDFVSGFKQSELAADLLAEFIVILSSYQEEGTQLFPAVFITENLKETLELTQGMDPIVIGSGEQTREYVRRAFKQCAPLAESREWAIYVTLKKKTMTYGIFRTNTSPLNPTPFERLRLSKDPELNLIGLTRLGGSFVEVRSTHGRFQYVNMTGDQEETTNPKEMIRKFVQSVTCFAPSPIKTHLQSFYYRVGIDILHANHGTLLAVVHHEKNVPSVFHDGILLEPRINVPEGIAKLLETGSLESFQQLIAWNQLIRKMTSMDGITLLDSSGAIVGYNCFIKSSALESKAKAAMLGGARRRAFDVLCTYLGESLSGVIYKSRDGVFDLELAPKKKV